jgi:hypothetical protein
MVDVKPVAWRFELARSRVWVDGRPAEWTDWSRPKVSLVEPCVPEGSIRNLTPLYEQPNTPTEDVERVASQVVERTVARLRELHDYAGRPSWEKVIAEELRAAIEAL